MPRRVYSLDLRQNYLYNYDSTSFSFLILFLFTCEKNRQNQKPRLLYVCERHMLGPPQVLYLVLALFPFHPSWPGVGPCQQQVREKTGEALHLQGSCSRPTQLSPHVTPWAQDVEKSPKFLSCLPLLIDILGSIPSEHSWWQAVEELCRFSLIGIIIPVFLIISISIMFLLPISGAIDLTKSDFVRFVKSV